MKVSSPAPATQEPPLAVARARFPLWGWAMVLGCITSLVAISGRTLWIDEALTAIKAMEPSLAAWWAAHLRERGSDLQMPIYMLGMWAWEKLAGSGEWSLRIANLPWFVGGLGAFAWGLVYPGRRARRGGSATGLRPTAVFACLVAVCSPFAWYYLDEARPYAMQMGASLILAGSLCRTASGIPLEPESRETRLVLGLLCVGVFCLSGSSLLGMIWAGAGGLIFLLMVRGRATVLLRAFRVPVLVLLLLLSGLAIYYLWTLAAGARATASAKPTVESTAFIGYELLGFGGLGPGRLDLRESGVRASGQWLPWLLPFAVTLLVVAWVGLRDWVVAWRARRGGSATGLRPTCWKVAAILMLPALVLLGTGFLASFRVLGRHFTPLLPAIILVLGTGLASLWRKGAWGRGVGILFLALCLASALQIRFASRHGKDDYRSAALMGHQALAGGQVVWWNAAEQGAAYYRLPVGSRPIAGSQAWFCMNSQPAALDPSLRPDLIIKSKADVYDVTGVVGNYIAMHGYTLYRRMPAFEVWARPPR